MRTATLCRRVPEGRPIPPTVFVQFIYGHVSISNGEHTVLRILYASQSVRQRCPLVGDDHRRLTYSLQQVHAVTRDNEITWAPQKSTVASKQRPPTPLRIAGGEIERKSEAGYLGADSSWRVLTNNAMTRRLEDAKRRRVRELRRAGLI